MTLANDLKTLRPGDTLVCRNGTLRVFREYDDDLNIVAEGEVFPTVWSRGNGKCGWFDWDIVRVIRAKKPKARAISDADFQSASKSVRKQYAGTIKALATTKAKRLEEMKGTK